MAAREDLELQPLLYTLQIEGPLLVIKVLSPDIEQASSEIAGFLVRNAYIHPFVRRATDSGVRRA